jgi:hypothetical protein
MVSGTMKHSLAATSTELTTPPLETRPIWLWGTLRNPSLDKYYTNKNYQQVHRNLLSSHTGTLFYIPFKTVMNYELHLRNKVNVYCLHF